MSKENEIQDELEKYWGQLDRVERMLIYLCQKINPVVLEVDDISDILPPKRAVRYARNEAFNK